MYITKIDLHHIRCFEDLEIDLKKDNEIILWATILGDNAVGKSTILKCIAMGLCDETSAGALMKESKAEYLRKGELIGHINLTLENNQGKIVEIKTQLSKKDIEDPVNVTQVISDGLSPWKDLFFCAYGASISGAGAKDLTNINLWKLFILYLILHPNFKIPKF